MKQSIIDITSILDKKIIPIIIFCCTFQCLKSQDLRISLPDTISLTDLETYKVFKSRKDTLNFMNLTDKTDLSQYKGKENKDIMRTMRKIKSAMQRDILYDEICGKSIAKLRKLTYANNIGEHHTVRSPKYALTKNGVIVIGKNGVIAPWDDMITKYVALGCYFVSFDKKVSYIKTVVHDPTFPSKYDVSLLDSLQYTYNKLPINDRVKFVPPTFEGDTISQFVKSNIRYPMIALENNISGDVIISFVVNPDRSVTNITIIRGPSVPLDKVSVHLIDKTNNLWNPGIIDGIAVPIEVKLIIRFSLSYD